jgi:DNA polymerase III gamma/tau subunit
LEEVIDFVCKKEQIQLTEEVMDKLTKQSEGSARKALVYLNQIMDLKTEEEQLDAIVPASMQAAAINLYRELCAFKPQWTNIAAILRDLNEDPEGVRRLILACARTSLLKQGGKMSSKAYLIIDTFRDNLYNTGAAGLAAQFWEFCAGSGK